MESKWPARPDARAIALPRNPAHIAAMDFMKWIASLDEVLFELMSWLVFWPVTLVRTAFGPLAMMRYADAQLLRPEKEQYAEALSPPVFLILTLVVAHLAGVALGQPDVILNNQRGVAGLVTNDTAAVAVRLVMFAAFPLLFSVILLAARRQTLSRSSLQFPFYAQCYPATVFAAVLVVAAEVGLLRLGPDGLPGLLILAAVLWLLAVETLWFRREHGFSWASALAMGLAGLVAGVAIVFGAMRLFLA